MCSVTCSVTHILSCLGTYYTHTHTHTHTYIIVVVCCFNRSVMPNSCGPMDNSLTSSSIPGISQTSMLEWVAISFSRGSFPPRDRNCISCIGRWVLYHCTTWKAHIHIYVYMQNWFINQFRKNQNNTAFTHIKKKKKKKEKERKEKVTKNAELELRGKKSFWSAFPIFVALHDTF